MMSFYHRDTAEFIYYHNYQDYCDFGRYQLHSDKLEILYRFDTSRHTVHYDNKRQRLLSTSWFRDDFRITSLEDGQSETRKWPLRPVWITPLDEEEHYQISFKKTGYLSVYNSDFTEEQFSMDKTGRLIPLPGGRYFVMKNNSRYKGYFAALDWEKKQILPLTEEVHYEEFLINPEGRLYVSDGKSIIKLDDQYHEDELFFDLKAIQMKNAGCSLLPLRWLLPEFFAFNYYEKGTSRHIRMDVYDTATRELLNSISQWTHGDYYGDYKLINHDEIIDLRSGDRTPIGFQARLSELYPYEQV